MSIDKHTIIGNAVAAVFEGLEGRQLMAASWVDNHKLSVLGTAAADRIEVQLSTNGSEMWTRINGVESQHYNTQMIYEIHIDAGSGNNRVVVDPRLSKTTTIITGGGNDTVLSGAGNDSIQTGGGRDLVNGGLGNDFINAGASNDKVNGGGGNDFINGGSGNDSLSADGGHDNLYGRRGNDKIYSDRDDSVDGGAGRDIVTTVASFKVLDVVPSPTIRQLMLVNTETGQAVSGYENLQNGVILDLSRLPAKFSIAARAGRDVESVFYSMSDGSINRVENSSTLAMTGSSDDKIVAWNIHAGTYTLTATPYAADNARGFVGEPRVLRFTVVNGSGTTGGTTGGDTGGTPSDTLAPRITLNATSSTIQAGQTLHIEATGTTVPGYQIEDAKFSWDFGDPGSRFNTLPGFNAAHVYERAGTYTVKLTVTAPGGRVSTATTTVNVTAAAISKTIFVSKNGSDSNDGLSASNPVRSIAYAVQIAGSDSQILLKRGETVNVNSTIRIDGHNIRVGTFGSGDAPRVVWNGDRSGRPVMFYISSTAQDVSVRGFTFDSIYNGDTEQTGMVIVFSVGGRNTTIRDNTFLNVGYAMNLNMIPTGFLAMDNSAPSETGIRDYFCWIQGTDVVVVGNNVANSTREHIVRVGGAERVLVANNSLTNLDRRSLGDLRDTAKGAITNQKGQYSYIANNELRGPGGVGPLGENDGLTEKWARFKHAAVEGNVMYGATFFLQHGAENVTFRDNTFFADDMAAISVKAYNSAYQRGVVDLVIDHNVVVNNGTTGNFLKLEGAAESVTLTNNVYVAPYLRPGSFGTAAVSVAMSDLSAFRLIGGNIWPSTSRAQGYANGGMMFVGLDYTTANHYDPARWNSQSVVRDDQFVDVRLDGVSLLTNSMLVRR